MLLNLSHTVAASRANGPGARHVTWVQGCTLRCPACSNPETHSHSPNRLVSVSELVAEISDVAAHIEGISVTGGEPLQQARAVAALLQEIRRLSLSVVLFSGYSLHEIQKVEEKRAVLAHVDVLIAGRYRAHAHLGHGLLGSENQRIHLLSNRYTQAAVDATPDLEILVATDGRLIFTGTAGNQVARRVSMARL